MTTTPKTCIFTETYYPVIGGGETQARTLAEELAAKGLPITVVTRRSHPELKKVEQYGRITVHRLPPGGHQHYKKWGLIVSSLPVLFRLRKEYDVLYVSGFRILGIPAVLISRLLDKRCVLKADSPGEMSGEFFAAGLSKMGFSSQSAIFRAFLAARNFLLCRADAYVAISSDLEQEMEAHGVDRSRIHAIPNSVDVERFRPVNQEEKQHLRQKLGVPEADRVVIYAGRLVTYKGLPLLLKVWWQIKQEQQDVHLLLVGSGGLDIHNCEDELRDYVAAQRMESTVRFTGPVQNVHEYLQAADVFIFPTENEAFGISLIEAMACGLAVIGTSVGGVKDILEHGKNGLVVRANDFQQLQEALERLIVDQDLARKLAAGARKTAQDRYATTIVSCQYVELFRQHTNLQSG